MLIRAVVGRHESFNASYYSLVACWHLHHWQQYPWPSIWSNITTHLSTGDPSNSKSIQVSLMLHNLSCRILSDSVSLLGGPLADQYTPRLCIILHFNQVSRAVLYSIAALSNLLSWNVLSSEDHQSSIRCDLWTFWSVRGGGPSVHSSGCQDNSGSGIGVQQKGQSRVKIL